MTRLSSVLFLVLFMDIVFIGCRSNTGKNTDNDSSVSVNIDEVTEVETIKVQRRPFNNEIISNGRVYTQNKADLFFNTSRTISKIRYKNGDYVYKGDTIAILENFELKNQLEQSRAQMERAWLDLTDALIGQGYELSDTSTMPAGILKTAKIRSGYFQSKSAFEMAIFNYNESVLVAPMEGTIANLFGKELCLPLANQPFCSIFDNHVFQVEFPILETEIPYVKNGQKVELSPFFDTGLKFEGAVDAVNPAVNDNGMVVVFALVKNSGSTLIQGMNVKISCRQSIPGQIVVPKKAVTIRADRDVIFTAENNMAKWNYVTIGHENNDYYTIEEGIMENDLVIVQGNTHLSNHASIRILNKKERN